MTKFTQLIKKNFANKKICILGFGREGQSTYTFFRKYLPKLPLAIADQNQALGAISQKTNLTYHLGPSYLKNLAKYDVIFRSPGIPFTQIEKWISKKAQVTSQTQLFFKLCPGQVIGVTGTKGKSTTSSLIYKVLKTKYKQTQLVGNIGYPPLDHLKHIDHDTKVVFELSSHQLSDLKTSPEIAVILNIFPEHLDYYSRFTQYLKAKANITNFQTNKDLVIYNQDDDGVRKIVATTKASTQAFSLRSTKKTNCFINQGIIYYKNHSHLEPIMSIKQSPLVGQFNLANLMPAIMIGYHFKIPKPKIVKAIKNFKPLSSRLEKLGDYAGVTFINDSLATVPQSTIKALNSLKGKVGVLIVGGFDRGVDQTSLAQAIKKSSTPTVILLPDTGKKIKAIINKSKLSSSQQFLEASNMKQAVKLALKNLKAGQTCLMSPGAASFNMFKDYRDRATQFKKAVTDLT